MLYQRIHIHDHGHELRGEIAGGNGGSWVEGGKGEKIGTTIIS